MKSNDSLDLEEKKVMILLGFKNDAQLKRLLRFLDKHGFKIYAVRDALEVKTLSKEEFERIVERKRKNRPRR